MPDPEEFEKLRGMLREHRSGLTGETVLGEHSTRRILAWGVPRRLRRED